MRPKKVSFDSDIEEVPLNQYINNGPSKLSKNCSIEKLRRYSIQTCEFCEAKCENRYDMLIHNSTHIIIPLLKETPCLCYKCNFFCISEEHLINHLFIKHNITLEKKVNRNVRRTFDEEFETEEHCTDDETLDNLVKKEQFSNEDALLQGFFLNCKVDIEKFDTPWLDISENDSQNNESVIKNNFNERHSKDCMVKLDSLTDKTKNDCVKMEKDIGDIKSEFGGVNSIHYSELMKPGIYQCKHCFKRFPTRYDVIVHEAKHLDLSKVFKKRPGRPPRCLQSNEKAITPPVYKCHICNRTYQLRLQLQTHLNYCLYKKDKRYVRVCKTCLGSSRINVDFSIVGKSVDQRYICWVCGQHYRKMTVIKLAQETNTKLQSIADRIKFEETVVENKSKINLSRTSKPKTNSERLKLIQQRFKLINKSAMYVPKFTKESVKRDKKIG